jgi:hypothetical protein
VSTTNSTTECTYGPPARSKLDLMGVRFFAPEAPPNDGGDPPTDPPADPPPGNEPPKPGPPPGKPEGEDEDALPEWAKKSLKKAREEAAALRVENRDKVQKQIDEALANGQKAWATELAKKLGVLEGEGEKTPEEIIAELQAERDTLASERDTLAAERRATKERNAIEGAAKANGGDTALVRAVLLSEGALKDIDPAADDYAAQVAAIVKAEIEKNPKLREVQVAGRSGGDAPPAGSPNPGGPKSIDELIADRRKRRGQ